jgi:hypothetical protein
METNTKVFSHSIRKKCQLCFQLSFWLKRIFHQIFGGQPDCQGINQRTQNDPQRVSGINALVPDCGCEKYRMSLHSPGVVCDSERLARFVFSPFQVDKKGRLNSGAFSHVHQKGCSIQRDTQASNDEITLFIKQFIESRDDLAWKGLLVANSSSVRQIMTRNSSQRAVCVYDTAEKENPSHGEICQTQHVLDKDDEAELRHDLLMVFGNKEIVPPTQYRDGIVWNRLPLQFQTRI